jgi:hypothetical protein
VIRIIFDQFVNGRKSYSDIRRQLNDAGIANRNGRPWTDGMIPTILANENYIGKTIYNRTSRRLGQKLVKNPDHAWVRGAAAIEPIVDPGIFARAQKLLAERRVEIAEDEMLLRLRLTLRRRAKLNSRIINTMLGLNHVSSYVKHFGSLRKAYALIGYVSPRDCDWIDTRDFWAAEQARHATELAEVLRTGLDLQAELASDGIGLDVGGERIVSFLVARRLAHRGADHAAQWKAYRRQISPTCCDAVGCSESEDRGLRAVTCPVEVRTLRRAFFRFSTSASERALRGKGGIVRCYQGNAGKDQPCRPNQLSIVEKTIEIRPAQSQGLRRAALTVRRYKIAPMSVP